MVTKPKHFLEQLSSFILQHYLTCRYFYKQQQQLKGETYSVRTFNSLAEQHHDSNIHLQPMK